MIWRTLGILSKYRLDVKYWTKNRTKSIKMLLVGIFQNSIRGRISGKKCNSNLGNVTKILLFFFPEQKLLENLFRKRKTKHTRTKIILNDDQPNPVQRRHPKILSFHLWKNNKPPGIISKKHTTNKNKIEANSNTRTLRIKAYMIIIVGF